MMMMKRLLPAEKNLQFIDAHHQRLGIGKEEIIEAAKYMEAFEARRVRDLFDKIDRSASAPVIRGGH
jgi:hypothetical protein